MNIPNRKSIRLPGYDYSQNGAYFITICTKDKQMLFGTVQENRIILNKNGQIAQEEIEATNRLRKENGIQVTKYVVMPNHVHLLIEIVGTRRAVSGAANPEKFSQPTKQSIPTIVRAYKSAVTRRLRNGHGTPCPYEVWQARCYEHVIRSDADYQKIWNYIDTNPIRWSKDCYFTTL